jgi:uncharacterized 2Fe-2S/4Fe-4S cluster protein (DUF4445 family)
MKHFRIIFEPEHKQIFIHEDATILEAASQAGIILNTSCGGKGTCNKCSVYIGRDERKVLACQYKIHSDLTVKIPTESRYFKPKILESGVSGQKAHADIYKRYQKTSQKERIFGMAVDIGTTTVVAKLIDMANSEVLATEATLNPQSQYGDDVISRIAFADSQENLKILQKTIIDCINDLITNLCRKISIDSNSVYELCAVGNTTMSHIFLGFPITQLGFSPYKAYSLDAYDFQASKLGLKMNPAGNVHTVENIAGFVGSDTISVALASDIDSTEQMTLIIDIGTNGEIVLGSGDNLYAASCAAGPAFEGGRINSGSRAAQGAIEAVILNEDDIDFDVIGNSQPRSICGSGLIDAVSVMLELGVLEKSGRFADFDSLKKKLPAAILKRLIKHNGESAFFLTETVFLNQSDIRHIQLAKAAIHAGIKLLLKKLNIEASDIEQVFLAGAFGNYIRRESALKIGLLPEIALEKIHFVGNAAASGAQMILLSTQSRTKARQLAQKIQYIELANSPDFQEVFADCINF